jgi:hypothetical protein
MDIEIVNRESAHFGETIVHKNFKMYRPRCRIVCLNLEFTCFNWRNQEQSIKHVNLLLADHIEVRVRPFSDKYSL